MLREVTTVLQCCVANSTQPGACRMEVVVHHNPMHILLLYLAVVYCLLRNLDILTCPGTVMVEWIYFASLSTIINTHLLLIIIVHKTIMLSRYCPHMKLNYSPSLTIINSHETYIKHHQLSIFHRSPAVPWQPCRLCSRHPLAAGCPCHALPMAGGSPNRAPTPIHHSIARSAQHVHPAIEIILHLTLQTLQVYIPSGLQSFWSAVPGVITLGPSSLEWNDRFGDKPNHSKPSFVTSDDKQTMSSHVLPQN